MILSFGDGTQKVYLTSKPGVRRNGYRNAQVDRGRRDRPYGSPRDADRALVSDPSYPRGRRSDPPGICRVYQWDRNSFLYLQIWPELTGTNQLVAFDETGEVRTLYPTEPDRFFTGSGAAVPAPVESRIEVQRADSGKIASLTWSREGAPPRTARRVDIERREDVRFSNGNVQLAGTLISPTTSHPILQ